MKPIDKLKTKLAELFQLDQADLDFGIYRIMNAKREEITRFLDNDLLPQVQEAFKEYKSSDKAEIQKELDRVIERVKNAGLDPEQATKVRELRAKLAEEAVDVEALENEVFSHLYDFFRRYYDEGDFISMRRYKEGVYAIPYEGEEVKLHWANHDQYYIKTTEYFRDYSFRLPDGRRVHFKIIEADTEKDNIKATNNKDRRFSLHADNPVTEENGELVIHFEYGPDAEKRKQDDLNIETARTILAEKKVGLQWKAAFAEKWRRADGTVTERTILEKHLYDYTRRNTFDYFIHKDLGKFLRRELDFYIKNEVMHLDDVENESAARVEQYLSKIKVIRKISHKIIDFLAQIEDFQKKLWLKKKFVVETNYCVTLDLAQESLYPEIAKNDAQRDEWVRLFAIDEIKGDLAKPGYTKPLTVNFLKANQYLVLDTKFFAQKFKDSLLAAFEDLHDQIGGILLHGDNFHALSLFQCGYRNRVKCIFIDPPYNTGQDGFPYKDQYQHSSWLAMIFDRVRLGSILLKDDGIHFVSIGDDEVDNLSLVLSQVFSKKCVPFVWKSRAKPTNAGDAIYRPQIVAEFVLMNMFNDNIRFYPLKSGDQRSYPHEDENGKYRTTTILTSNRGRYRRDTMRFEIAGYTPPEEKRWKAGPDEIQRLYENHRIGFGEDGEPHKKVYEGDEDEQHTPLWTFLPEDITGTAESGKGDLSAILGGDHGLDSVKPKELIAIFLNALVPEGIVTDFFGGSGTTGHAVIDLNREDGGKRKYILVEMADYFDTVLKPRIQKVIYSKDWKDGKPVSRDGVSHMFKYIRLESYEDALANLHLKCTEAQQSLLNKSDSFRESYMLRYMLDAETKGSSSLLDLGQFEDPFSYQLLVGTGSVGETKPVNVDLVETFNWLLGLKVKHMDHIGGFRIVEGTNPKGEKVLVIWRKIHDLSEKDTEEIQRQREKSNEDLEAFFKKQQYNTMDMEFDIIYVNGDNNLMNIPMAPEGEGLEPRYKVRLIEEEFKRLMFDVKDV